MEFTTQIGLALGYAHKQGVVHRDVKPSNILIADDNWALLTDFGLAKIRAVGRQLTRSGMGVGTPDYMAPEQAQGQPVDGRTDLYALGAMLYEMVTGHLPFDAESGMAVVVKHITEPPHPPREFRPDLPIAVEQVLLKSLEKNPDDRYPTAEAMIAALARAVGPQADQVPEAIETPIAAPPISVTLRPDAQTRWKKFTTDLATTRAAVQSRSRQWIDRMRAEAQPAAANMRTHRRAISIAIGAVILMVCGLLIVPGALQSSPVTAPTATRSIAPASSVPVTATRTLTPTLAPTATASSTNAPSLAPIAGMVAVPAGSFTMGAQGDKYDRDEMPQHVVTLNSFYIDVVEVTNAQFARFADASGYDTEAEKAGDAITWRNFNTPDRQRFPVTYVSWNDAVEYCAWAGKRLPTEAEWEKAARGRTKYIYPWGNTFNVSFANTSDLEERQPVAVASNSAASPYGAYDMVGNVWEWVQDWYGVGYYADSPKSNPPGPDSGITKVIRGGSFKTEAPVATSATRGHAGVDNRGDDIGFRCAK
jgi:serine/threonine-protein kinase